jgi:hypothetical protein
MTSEHVSGAENGAERAEKLVSGSGTFEKKRGAGTKREIGEREQSGERKSKKIVERGAAF